MVPTPALTAAMYGGQVKAAQSRLVDARIALIESFAALRGSERRAAVADVVLGARQDRQRVRQIRPLQAAHRRLAELRDQLGILGEAFVGASPADILRDRDARREGPLNTGGADLFRGGALHLLDQLRIPRAAEPDVVREDHRPQHVIVAVDGVDAIQNGDAEPRIGGARLQAVVKIGPGFEAVAFLGVRIAAAQQRAHEVLSRHRRDLSARSVRAASSGRSSRRASSAPAAF